MEKILIFNNRILTHYKISDYFIKKFLKNGIKKIYFTSKYNFKVASKYLILRKKITPEEKFFFLLQNLETKNYNDYPVYLFFYGKKLIYKEFFKNYIIKNENYKAIDILTEKIEKLLKNKKKAVVTFDNFHLIRFKNSNVHLFYYKEAENLYALKGKYLWINLSVSDNVRFLNFGRLKIYGNIYDPFTIWKLSFLNAHNFKVI